MLILDNRVFDYLHVLDEDELYRLAADIKKYCTEKIMIDIGTVSDKEILHANRNGIYIFGSYSLICDVRFGMNMKSGDYATVLVTTFDVEIYTREIVSNMIMKLRYDDGILEILGECYREWYTQSQ